jgi:hypothetical protein
MPHKIRPSGKYIRVDVKTAIPASDPSVMFIVLPRAVGYVIMA